MKSLLQRKSQCTYKSTKLIATRRQHRLSSHMLQVLNMNEELHEEAKYGKMSCEISSRQKPDLRLLNVSWAGLL